MIKYAVLVIAMMAICAVVTGESGYCTPPPTGMNVSIIHEGDWFNITLTNPACFICIDNGAGYGDVECTPCPTATFSSNVTCGVGTFGVAFTDNTGWDNTTTDYFWDFGDGNTSMDQNPENVYSFPGVFDVKFMVNSTTLGVEWANETGYIRARAVGDTCDMATTNFGDENGGWEIPFMLIGMGAMAFVGYAWYSRRN